jgi:hypothetical protein
LGSGVVQGTGADIVRGCNLVCGDPIYRDCGCSFVDDASALAFLVPGSGSSVSWSRPARASRENPAADAVTDPDLVDLLGSDFYSDLYSDPFVSADAVVLCHGVLSFRHGPVSPDAYDGRLHPLGPPSRGPFPRARTSEFAIQ